MVGIANRPNGYDDEFAEFLAPFLSACATIIASYRQMMQSQRDRRQLQLAKFTLHHAVEAIFLISREGTVRHTNEAAAEFTEWPIHELRKRHVRDLVL